MIQFILTRQAPQSPLFSAGGGGGGENGNLFTIYCDVVEFVKDHRLWMWLWICQYLISRWDGRDADYYPQLWQWSSLKWSPGDCELCVVTIMTSVENHKKYVGCQSLKFIITTSIIYCCYSPNEHKYISDVMILSERKHFSIRSSQLIQWVDQFIIATFGNIQMKIFLASSPEIF